MQIARVSNVPGGEVRVHGKSQGFMGLPVRHETVIDPQMGECNEMTCAWLPTPEELRLLNEGAAVHVHIRGWTNPPPMLVDVGEVPSDG